MIAFEKIDTSWFLLAFDRSVLSTTPTIVCCPADEIPGFHASAVTLAHKRKFIVVDVEPGEDPREAIFAKIGRATTVSAAVEAHLKKTKRDIYVIVRDADRFAAGETGLAILWALKSARDRVEPRLRLLFFGTDRAALQSFVSPKSAPFLDSKVLP
jgi:hypothetical protein